jgi:hypothetical protein
MVTKRQRDLVGRVRAAERAAEPFEWEPFPGVVYRSEFREGAGIGGHGEWHMGRDLVVDGRVRKMSALGLPFGKTKRELEAHMRRIAENDWALNKPFILSDLYRLERRPLRTPDDDPPLRELARLSRALRAKTSPRYVSDWEAVQHELKMLRWHLQDAFYSADELNGALLPYDQIRPR